MKNSRGVSAVVATVLIIMITVASVAILWSTIIPMIKDSLGYSMSEKASLIIVTDRGYTVYDSVNNRMTVQIQRGVDEVNLTGIQFIFSSDDDTYDVFVEESSLVVASGQIQTVGFILPFGFGKPTSVRIAPIIDGELKDFSSEISSGGTNLIIESSGELPLTIMDISTEGTPIDCPDSGLSFDPWGRCPIEVVEMVSVQNTTFIAAKVNLSIVRDDWSDKYVRFHGGTTCINETYNSNLSPHCIDIVASYSLESYIQFNWVVSTRAVIRGTNSENICESTEKAYIYDDSNC